MVPYLLKTLALAVFSFIIIYFYYFTNAAHIENFDGYLSYIIIIGVIYGVYKFFQLEFSEKKADFSLFKILGFFLLHLLVLCILFFSYNNLGLGSGIVLFFKILYFSFIPVSIVLITLSFGRRLLSYLPHTKEETSIYRFILSLVFGFFSFIFLLNLFGFLGFYNLYTVFLILGGLVALSYKELGNTFSSIFNYKFEVDIEEGSYLRLISTEFLFLVSTLILSISLISIVRPFPIGWDDLGAYMNVPHLMAEAGSLMSFGGMMAWQTFTGIGYMFGSPTQAFFLNNVGGILSFILMVLIISDLLKSKLKTFLNIPLLVATLFISMPMVVFQQAKDMKLDAGLFFVSITILYILFKTFRKTDSKSKFLSNIFSKFSKQKNTNSNLNNVLDNNNFLTDKNLTYKLIFIIGLLAGFAFAIKFTTLLLISAIIGLLFYTEIGFAGFLGYLAIFFALFTKAGLWEKMNIAYDKTDLVFINMFSLISLVVGIIFLVIGLFRHKQNIKRFFIVFLIFIAGLLTSLSPWIGKNIVQSYPNISVNSVLGGKTESFKFDKNLILSEEEIVKIEENKRQRMDTDGTVSNEDFGRYFGYEKGINNYIKLPWNLTMQRNQGGEFTDIGFLLLALLPVILLFLPFRNILFYVVIVGVLGLELAVFQFGFLTNFLASFTLPGGYGILLGLYLATLLFFIYGLKREEEHNLGKINLFKLNLIFAGFYTFLWSISAYGIVWYGITMYFSFLLMIAIGAYYITSYNEEEGEKVFFIKLLGSIVFCLIILIYFVNSVFPHSFNNLKGAGYAKYKAGGQVTTTNAPYLYHTEYLKILFHTNIDDTKKEDFLKEYINEDIIKNVAGIEKMDIYTVKAILNDIASKNPTFAKKARSSLNNIYKNISNPTEEYKSNIGIYRIGTFLKYHISENHKRLLEDSLITKFNDYIYDSNINNTVENLKKLGVGYLLVDLNAATIDKDARHNLTTRYERLLSTFTSDKLELVETDSVCLKVALEQFNKSEKFSEDRERFIVVGGVNYESYMEDGTVVNRGNKLLFCYRTIDQLIKTNQVDENNYSYLLNINNYLKENKDKFKTEKEIFALLQQQINHGYKVLFRIR